MSRITITEHVLEQLKTPAGGYNKASMEILGVWPLVSGWANHLIGSSFPERKLRAAIKAAAQGKKHHFRGNIRRRP